MSKEPLTLRRKLLLARKATEAVTKKGEAEWGTFARYEDVLEVAEEQLLKRDIIWIPSMAEESLHFGGQGQGAIAKAAINYEVTDTKTGESLIVRWAGTGHDVPGDKALFKATTGTHKYLLAALLSIPFGSDPEEADASSTQGAPAPGRPDAGDGPGMLVLADIAKRLEAMGAPSDEEAVKNLLQDCGINADTGTGLVPSTVEQSELVHFELKRIEQDCAAEEVDLVPSREKPLPPTDLPEPDWTGLRDGSDEVTADV